MNKLHFVKNTGQFRNPMVAWVANVTDDFVHMYKGADRVELLREGLDIVGWKHVGDALYNDSMELIYDGEVIPNGDDFADEADSLPLLDQLFPGRMFAVSGSHQICVMHGTAAAAFLNVTVNR
jgi:hypothetical protein